MLDICLNRIVNGGGGVAYLYIHYIYYMNFLDKDLNTNAYLVVIYEKTWYFRIFKRVISMFSNMYFSDVCAGNK